MALPLIPKRPLQTNTTDFQTRSQPRYPECWVWVWKGRAEGRSGAVRSEAGGKVHLGSVPA